MVIDHVGIVVGQLEAGIRQWADLFGYKKNSDIVLNTRQKVKVVFLSKEGSVLVKLIEPSGPDSPVFQFAKRGGGLHHLCLRCESIDFEIPLLQEKGARLVVPPQPGEAFCGNRIAFLLASNNLNLELIDTDQKVGLAVEAQTFDPAEQKSDLCG